MLPGFSTGGPIMKWINTREEKEASNHCSVAVHRSMRLLAVQVKSGQNMHIYNF